MSLSLDIHCIVLCCCGLMDLPSQLINGLFHTHNTIQVKSFVVRSEREETTKKMCNLRWKVAINCPCWHLSKSLLKKYRGHLIKIYKATFRFLSHIYRIIFCIFHNILSLSPSAVWASVMNIIKFNFNKLHNYRDH